jgi:hypothetical protein
MTAIQTALRADTTDSVTTRAYPYAALARDAEHVTAMGDGDFTRLVGYVRSQSYPQSTLADCVHVIADWYGLPADFRAVPTLDLVALRARIACNRAGMETATSEMAESDIDLLVTFVERDLNRSGYRAWLDVVRFGIADSAAVETIVYESDWPTIRLFAIHADGVCMLRDSSTRGVSARACDSFGAAVRIAYGFVPRFALADVERLDPQSIFHCFSCASVCWVDDSRDISATGQMACYNCASDCPCCGDTAATDTMSDVEIDDYMERVCESCADDTHGCTRCGTAIHDNYSHTRCNSCRQNSRVISGYHSNRHSRPLLSDAWTRARNGRHNGFELEVEYVGRGDREDVAGAINEAVNASGTRMHFESDGSLADGFEMISFPMSLPAACALVSAALSVPEVTQLRSHDTTTCGLHVHISRAALSKLTIAKMSAFLSAPDSKAFVKAFARRYGNSYCNAHTRKLAVAGVACDRYELLNVTNRDTVEFRLFRGSLSVQTVCASLEFCHALCDWAAVTAMSDLSVSSFLAFVFNPKNANDTRFLRSYVALRASRVPSLSVAFAVARAANKTHHTGKRALVPSYSNVETEN